MENHNIRLAIADDHAILRQSLKNILNSRENLSVVFDAGDGRELLEKLQTHEVDVVLLDLEMPVMSGIEALLEIRSTNPKVKCLILSYFNELEFAVNAIKNGAKGFISKNCTPNFAHYLVF